MLCKVTLKSGECLLCRERMLACAVSSDRIRKENCLVGTHMSPFCPCDEDVFRRLGDDDHGGLGGDKQVRMELGSLSRWSLFKQV